MVLDRGEHGTYPTTIVAVDSAARWDSRLAAIKRIVEHPD
jgi:hypothetical protein